MSDHNIDALLGVIFDEVTSGDEAMMFSSKDYSVVFFHEQDCCEDVWLDGINGDLADLIGSPIIRAVERVGDYDGEPKCGHWLDDSITWTFYEFATIKGTVSVRWCGTSNGYYSEAVNYLTEGIKPDSAKQLESQIKENQDG